MTVVSPHQKLHAAAPPKLDNGEEFVPAPRHMVHTITTNAEFRQALSDAAAPYSVEVSAQVGGFGVSGDTPSKTLVTQILKELSETPEKYVEPLHMPAIRAAMVEVHKKVLKRDLAFRLEGILAPVRPMTLAQLSFMQDLLDKSIPLLFGTGPTGTGKTYMAIAAGINLLATEAVKHLIITKPHELEPGEVVSPDLRAEKVCDEQFNVYFDVLHDLIGREETEVLLAQKKLEVTPLGLLRGRTFNDAFIIMDEAHITNTSWMRLAVTRMGQRSRMVVCGDTGVTHLRSGETSGLTHLLQMIEGQGIGKVHTFAPRHVIRNDVVAKLETLYATEDDDSVFDPCPSAEHAYG